MGDEEVRPQPSQALDAARPAACSAKATNSSLDVIEESSDSLVELRYVSKLTEARIKHPPGLEQRGEAAQPSTSVSLSSRKVRSTPFPQNTRASS
jgi:hypothetical protein